jgi:dihydrolipoamide dehydrogenase
MGIKVGTPELDLPAMMGHKQDVIDGNVAGIDFLFKKNKIDVFHGTGKIVAAGKVEVTPIEGDAQTVEAKNIVIATGSDVANLPGVEIDEKQVVSSTGALELDKVPSKMIVVGAGVIGLELGSVWRRLGSEVTVVEFLDRILPGMDGEVVKNAQRMFKKQGFKFKLSTKVTGVEKTDAGLKIAIESVKNGKTEELEADVVLVAIGRRPYTDGLGLDAVGVQLDDRGRVVTDGHFKSTVDGIYAIGDVIEGPMLAHKAEDDGVALAEILAGQAGHVDYNLVPGVVYTMPEIAVLGQTEEQLKEAGIAYNVGKFPFSANGRAKAQRHTDGFVKILACKETDKVLGAHMIGAGVGEMIHEVSVLMAFGGAAEDLARTIHAHPTLSEAVKEAALAVDKRPIHM